MKKLNESNWKVVPKSSGVFTLMNDKGEVHHEYFTNKQDARKKAKILETEKGIPKRLKEENAAPVNNMGDGNIASFDPVLLRQKRKAALKNVMLKR